MEYILGGSRSNGLTKPFLLELLHVRSLYLRSLSE